MGYSIISDAQIPTSGFAAWWKSHIYEYPPRIESLRLNTVSAIHSLTVKDDKKRSSEIRVSNGLPGQVFKLRETPILDKTLKLSMEERMG